MKKNMVPDVDDKLIVIESSHERRRCCIALDTTIEVSSWEAPLRAMTSLCVSHGSDGVILL